MPHPHYDDYGDCAKRISDRLIANDELIKSDADAALSGHGRERMPKRRPRRSPKGEWLVRAVGKPVIYDGRRITRRKYVRLKETPELAAAVQAGTLERLRRVTEPIVAGPPVGRNRYSDAEMLRLMTAPPPRLFQHVIVHQPPPQATTLDADQADADADRPRPGTAAGVLLKLVESKQASLNDSHEILAERIGAKLKGVSVAKSTVTLAKKQVKAYLEARKKLS